MKKLIGLVLLLLIAAGAAAAAMYVRVHQPFRGYDAAEQFVDIPQGTGSVPIGQRLVAAGIERARLFSWAETARRTADAYRAAMA